MCIYLWALMSCFVCGDWRVKLRHCLSGLASQRSMKSVRLPGASSQIAHRPNVHPQFWQPNCTMLFYAPQCCCSRKSEHTNITRSLRTPPHSTPHLFWGRRKGVGASHLHPSVFLFSHFFDWLDSMLISMSHYLLEYSGECFQLLPFQLL